MRTAFPSTEDYFDLEIKSLVKLPETSPCERTLQPLAVLKQWKPIFFKYVAYLLKRFSFLTFDIM